MHAGSLGADGQYPCDLVDRMALGQQAEHLELARRQPLQQAAATGTAILTYKVNPDEFLTRYRCGLSGQGNWSETCRTLKTLLENDRYRQFGQNARRYAEQYHDIKTIIERYKTLFTENARPREEDKRL